MNPLISKISITARISLVCIFLVIIAGSIVRMTGSGMGCPDWPKCFGYYVPPTDIETLTFNEGREFKQNQMVILDDTLWVANKDFVAGNKFDRADWHKYPKHDYAVFNAAHTLTEYLNRLMTAILAFPTLVLFVLCAWYSLKTKKMRAVWLASGVLFSIGFVAWLGKLVVDGNLHQGKVTLHMIGSMMIILHILAVISYFSQSARPEMPMKMKWTLRILLFLSIVQILIGTQVREEIDILNKSIDDRSYWIESLSWIFQFHRSFSIIVVLATLYVYFLNLKMIQRFRWINILALVVLAEAVAGIVLAYFDVPRAFQPTHLFFALVMYAILLSLLYTQRKIRVSAGNLQS